MPILHHIKEIWYLFDRTCTWLNYLTTQWVDHSFTEKVIICVNVRSSVLHGFGAVMRSIAVSRHPRWAKSVEPINLVDSSKVLVKICPVLLFMMSYAYGWYDKLEYCKDNLVFFNYTYLPISLHFCHNAAGWSRLYGTPLLLTCV